MNEQIIKIAERIRELREISEISVEALAKKLNIDVETYKKYEAGATDIPVSLIYDLAGIFKVNLTEILSGTAPKLNIYQVVRDGKGLNVERFEQYKYQNLAYNFSNKKIEPFLVEAPASNDDAPIHENIHNGQEFNYILEGSVCMKINGKEKILNAGDSIYFDSKYPHGMKALNGEKAKFIAIILN